MYIFIAGVIYLLIGALIGNYAMKKGDLTFNKWWEFPLFMIDWLPLFVIAGVIRAIKGE